MNNIRNVKGIEKHVLVQWSIISPFKGSDSFANVGSSSVADVEIWEFGSGKLSIWQ